MQYDTNSTDSSDRQNHDNIELHVASFHDHFDVIYGRFDVIYNH